jgi:hypothetical protein
MPCSPISSAGKLTFWLEVEQTRAAWEERITGALVLQGTQGTEHVSEAGVCLHSPPVSVTSGKLCSVELDATRWTDILVGANDTLRLPFAVTMPGGINIYAETDLVGSVILHAPPTPEARQTVRVVTPPVSDFTAATLAHLHGFRVVAKNIVRSTLSFTWPGDLPVPAEPNQMGSLVLRPPRPSAVGLTVRVAPPPAFAWTAAALARLTGLTGGRWVSLDEDVGASMLLRRGSNHSTALKAAELQLRLVEGELCGVLQVEWSGRALSGFWPGRSAHRRQVFRFQLPYDTEAQIEQFLAEELLPRLTQRSDGNLPIPAETTLPDEHQLPRIVSEPQ